MPAASGQTAFGLGFGGSMPWFGSSAGVALAYVVGFAIMLVVSGWHPHAPHKVDTRSGATPAGH